jgi:hypothetical protein
LFKDEMEYDFVDDCQDYWASFRGSFHRAPYARPHDDVAWEARRVDIFQPETYHRHGDSRGTAP